MEKKTQYLVELAYKHLPRNYAPPGDFVLKSGSGCYLKDVNGNTYLDMLACYSAANAGYANKEITKAVLRQITENGIVCNANCFWEEQKILFARDLAKFCEDFISCGLNIVLPMNSGAEAVETALKIARKWGYLRKNIAVDAAEIICCENNFHGRTLGAISMSTVVQYKNHFGPLLPGIKVIPFADIDALNAAINSNTAAFLVEPVQGEGGVIIPPRGYLAEVNEICDKQNILFILDEIQSGFGRTGKMFACNYDGVIPDMIILGKALGGGFPISAVVGRYETMGVLDPGDHGSTFGGNPLACAAARASLRFIRKHRPDRRAAELGFYFKNKLNEIAAKSPHIKEVRIIGLWVGIEVRHDGPMAYEFCERLYKEGILCKETREYTIRMSPPLTITRKELDFALEKIKKVFT
ncbi:MAG: ornithine--oxo-acid transaminase [Candidatus Azambacteria bacterium]|nr:ornithine--oxo-acid transaminase [Candidatus Azambacteria bacterium]